MANAIPLLELGKSWKALGWTLATCPMAEATEVERRDRASYYTFEHRNEHSGERFRVTVREKDGYIGEIKFEFR